MKIEETSVVLDIYSDKINAYLANVDENWLEKWEKLSIPLMDDFDCFNVDHIDWTVKGEYVTLSTPIKNKEKVIKYLKEFESNL